MKCRVVNEYNGAAAPVAIYAWIRERIALGKNKPGDPQLVEAFECARHMEAQRKQEAPIAS